jgi:hypothetical protein
MWWLIEEGCVGIEGEGFGPVGKEEEGTGSHPANPKNIESEMEPFFQQAVAIGVHKVLESEDEAKAAGGEEDGADEVGHFFGGALSHDV